MPVHDWKKVDAGLFHAFHQVWTVELCQALNNGMLPPEYWALPEQKVPAPIPDVPALRIALATDEDGPTTSQGAVAVADAPPRAHVVQRSEEATYARKANRVVVRHRHGQVVSVIEIVSPGNKASLKEVRDFVQKASNLVRAGVNVMVIDLLPPTKREPRGLHPLIWEEVGGDEDDWVPDKPLTLAAYDAGPPEVAYVVPVAVGDDLPDMPLFLRPGHYVSAPLESTYQESLSIIPPPLRLFLGSP